MAEKAKKNRVADREGCQGGGDAGATQRRSKIGVKTWGA